MISSSRVSSHPPPNKIVTLADAAYCYDRVNHVIMSLVWLVLTNGNIPSIVAALICLQMMKFFQRTGYGKSKNIFWRSIILSLHDGAWQSWSSILDSAERGSSQCVDWWSVSDILSFCKGFSVSDILSFSTAVVLSNSQLFNPFIHFPINILSLICFFILLYLTPEHQHINNVSPAISSNKCRSKCFYSFCKIKSIWYSSVANCKWT